MWSTEIIAAIGGAMLGACIGFVFCSICVAARNDDDRRR